MNEIIDLKNRGDIFILNTKEVELLSHIIQERVRRYEAALAKNALVNISLIELMDYTEINDAQHVLNSLKELYSRIEVFQNKKELNDVEFLESRPMFRSKENIKTYRIRREGFDRIVYVQIGSDGVYYFYPSLEALVDSYSSGLESKTCFGCTAGIENYMVYWKG